MLANINRDPKKRPEPYGADDFIYWRKAEKTQEDKPLDAESLSRRIKRALFKR